jgi:hypothetical protein
VTTNTVEELHQSMPLRIERDGTARYLKNIHESPDEIRQGVDVVVTDATGNFVIIGLAIKKSLV